MRPDAEGDFMIGKRLKCLAVERSLNVPGLAHRARLSVTTVRRVFSDDPSVRLKTLVKIANALGHVVRVQIEPREFVR